MRKRSTFGKRPILLKFSNLTDGFLQLVRSRLFWLISFLGNSFILAGAGALYFLEGDRNPGISGFLDSLVWSVGIVTTVGGHVTPVTVPGKLLSICMMFGGAIFLWTYMAMFVGAIVDPELKAIERDVSDIYEEVEKLEQAQ